MRNFQRAGWREMVAQLNDLAEAPEAAQGPTEEERLAASVAAKQAELEALKQAAAPSSVDLLKEQAEELDREIEALKAQTTQEAVAETV